MYSALLGRLPLPETAINGFRQLQATVGVVRQFQACSATCGERPKLPGNGWRCQKPPEAALGCLRQT
eukprot:15430937-Alexandrium_andersonii.AAC.1